MRKLGRLFFFCFVIILISIQSCADLSGNGGDYDSSVVYVTKSGSCYHKRSCSTIKGNNVTSMSKSTAKSKGYKRCDVCKP